MILTALFCVWSFILGCACGAFAHFCLTPISRATVGGR